jgi:hypothetical protein
MKSPDLCRFLNADYVSTVPSPEDLGPQSGTQAGCTLRWWRASGRSPQPGGCGSGRVSCSQTRDSPAGNMSSSRIWPGHVALGGGSYLPPAVLGPLHQEVHHHDQGAEEDKACKDRL